MVGTWSFIGFTDGSGSSHPTTGSWLFRTDGTVRADWTITVQGNPQSGALLGTYVQTGNNVIVITSGTNVTNSLTLTGNGSNHQVTLTNDELPKNTITLRRR